MENRRLKWWRERDFVVTEIFGNPYQTKSTNAARLLRNKSSNPLIETGDFVETATNKFDGGCRFHATVCLDPVG